MKYLRALLSTFIFCGLSVGITNVFGANPEITVYNQNFAVVKDYRDISLHPGVNTVMIDDVAALIDPTSVHFKSLSAPDAVTVLEQNFQYDLINKQNILNRMVGKKIGFIKNGTAYQGVLLNPATSVLRTQLPGSPYKADYQTAAATEFAVQTPQGVLLTTLDQITLDTLPKGLFPRPALTWLLRSTQGGLHHTEFSYMTDGITWLADYVVVLNAADNRLDLNGWVTLDNQSGASYENATLKLVAGNVRKIRDNVFVNGAARQYMAAEAAVPAFKEQSFFEYHLYTLQSKTNLPNNETKQISLIQSTGIPVTKRFVFDPTPTFRIFNEEDGNSTEKVKVLLNLKNNKENRLGLPLPKGRVRVYKADDAGSLQFVGEDSIDHTPVNEPLNLYLGDAFDLVGEKTHLSTLRIDKVTTDRIQIKLRNHKKQAARIEVIERPYGNWSIEDASDAYTKKNAQMIVFPVTVPAHGEYTLTYTIKTTT